MSTIVPRPVLTMLSALFVLFSEIDQEDADAFFDAFISGVGLEEGSPILALRTLLTNLRSRSKATKIDQNYVAALVIKAWNAWRAGLEVTTLYYRPGGANPEKFPVIQ